MIKASEMIRSIVGLEDIAKDQSYIYELYKGDECVYVGQTQGLLSRISAHTGQKDFDSIKTSVCYKYEANDKEADSIVRLNPKYNCQLPTSYKYITLQEFRLNIGKMLFNGPNTPMDIKFSYRGSYWVTTEDVEMLKTALIGEIDAINERKLHNRLKSESRIREIESGLKLITGYRSVFSKTKANSQQGVIADLIADEVERIKEIQSKWR